jgi:hypothetical protein
MKIGFSSCGSRSHVTRIDGGEEEEEKEEEKEKK